jgi:hypothetical protein
MNINMVAIARVVLANREHIIVLEPLLRAMRMEETIAAPPRKKRPCVSDVRCVVGNSATGDDYRLRAVARPWRAGADIGDFVRRTNRDLRKL